MYVEQIYTNCLAEASYYIESNGEAAIIDPIRDTEIYIQKAKARNATIKYIFETHFHADFVSGHIDLSKLTQAPIIYGPLAETAYQIISAKDNEVFHIGKIQIKVLHTPGHTPESSCFLLIDEAQKPHCIFSGDTLFVGDVGRPDLLDGKMTKEALAEMMYNSLQNKIKPLADDVIVYPAHGPGSACGKNIGKETYSTIGEQRQSNYSMSDISKEKFIEMLTTGLNAPPAYFFDDARINKMGYISLEDIKQKGLKALSVNEFKAAVNNGISVIDTRMQDAFEKGFVPSAYNVGLGNQFAIWAATLLPLSAPYILVTESGKEEESIVRLARVGFDNVIGYLEGGMESWKAANETIETVQSIFPKDILDYPEHQIIDVRKQSEYDSGHLAEAQLLPLEHLQQNIDKINSEKPYIIHCAGGYRSMLAAAILKRNGVKKVVNVYGGYAKIKEEQGLMENIV